MGEILPFDVPPRAELWRRIRLAESILNHRPLVPQSTVDDLRRVLRGELADAPRPGKGG